MKNQAQCDGTARLRCGPSHDMRTAGYAPLPFAPVRKTSPSCGESSPDATSVDALLTGEITAVAIQPVSFTTQQLASRYTITMSARVELRDVRENKVLWENPNLVFRQEYEAQSAGQAQPDPAAFFGQDQNALDRMTTEFARSIVSAILEAF